jgi:integrase/recombinase XerD
MSISPLRQRMIGDMTTRRIGEKTQKNYVRCVKSLAAFIGRSPETATAEDLRLYRLHLVESPLGASSVNAYMSALRFFFGITLDKADLLKCLFHAYESPRLPTVLTQDEVARLLDAAPSAKYKAALSVAYGAGLRASEVLSLKVSDVDSARMLLRVEQGKGRKDRHAMLSPMLLDILREWWRIGRPVAWLFPGQNPVNPLTTRQLNRACHAAAQLAEINKRVSLHTQGPSDLAGQSREAGAGRRLRRHAQTAPLEKVVRLYQGAVRGAEGRACLPVALHPPGGDLEHEAHIP